MKKVCVSLIGSLIIGLTISYFTLEYNGQTIHYADPDTGVITKTINELDFDLITNSFVLILVVSVLIFLTMTIFEKKSR